MTKPSETPPLRNYNMACIFKSEPIFSPESDTVQASTWTTARRQIGKLSLIAIRGCSRPAPLSAF